MPTDTQPDLSVLTKRQLQSEIERWDRAMRNMHKHCWFRRRSKWRRSKGLGTNLTDERTSPVSVEEVGRWVLETDRTLHVQLQKIHHVGAIRHELLMRKLALIERASDNVNRRLTRLEQLLIAGFRALSRQIGLHPNTDAAGMAELLEEVLDSVGEMEQRFAQEITKAEREIVRTREDVGYAIDGLQREFQGGPYENDLRAEVEETKRLAEEARDEARRAADEPHIIYY